MPPFDGPQADRVNRASRPVQFAAGAEFVQDDAVESGPDPGPTPLGETPIDRLPARTEHRRHLPPSTARGGHEDDRGQGFTVTRSTPTATLRAYNLRRRYNPPEQYPQLVRRQPFNQIRHARFNERSSQRKRRLSRTRKTGSRPARNTAKFRRVITGRGSGGRLDGATGKMSSRRSCSAPRPKPAGMRPRCGPEWTTVHISTLAPERSGPVNSLLRGSRGTNTRIHELTDAIRSEFSCTSFLPQSGRCA
jgi:hypothetical protein